MDLLRKYKLLIMFLMIVVLMIVLAYWISQQLLGHLDKNMPGFGKTGTRYEIGNENNTQKCRIDLFTIHHPA
jgi:hypothetical protein